MCYGDRLANELSYEEALAERFLTGQVGVDAYIGVLII
jgi:hypothetical protein